MADMTPADVMAMSNDGFGNSGWWIILILFFLFGGGFGGNSQANMSDEFIKRDIFNTNANVSATGCATQKEVLENRYATQLANNEIQKDILLGNANLQKDLLLGFANTNSSQSLCCCDLKTAIHQEGELTRQLITENKIADLQYQLGNANTIISNQVQTQNILNALGKFYTNPPYAGYYGTTIS